MSIDGTKVANNAGTLTWTPATGSGGTIGFTAAGVMLYFTDQWAPVKPEDYCESPMDFIRLGGPIWVQARAWQMDGVTRAALAPYFVSGSSLVYDLSYNGRLASEIANGTLAFAPPTPPSGKTRLGWTAGVAVALLAARQQVEISFRKKTVTEYLLTWSLLPNGSDIPITVTPVTTP